VKSIDRSRVLTLLEAYEPLLTKRQASIMDAYFRYDLSLSEIAEEEQVSRSGALDAIHVSIGKLEDYEQKLGFVKKTKRYYELVNEGSEGSLNTLREMLRDGI